MGEAFLFGSGGGNPLKNAYAIINVTYPKGATVTCANTELGKTLTAGNTMGAWSFAVPGDGKWIVTATLDSKSANKEVEITEKGQAKAVSLTFEWYIFKENEGLGENTIKRLNGTITNDASSIKIQSATSSAYSMIIEPAIPNIKDFKQLKVAANVGNGYGNCTFGLCNSADTTYDQLKNNTNVIAKLTPAAKNARDTYTIDLSNIAATETNAYFYTLCPNGAHTTYFYDIVVLPEVVSE